jgi:hypothetical protein
VDTELLLSARASSPFSLVIETLARSLRGAATAWGRRLCRIKRLFGAVRECRVNVPLRSFPGRRLHRVLYLDPSASGRPTRFARYNHFVGWLVGNIQSTPAFAAFNSSDQGFCSTHTKHHSVDAYPCNPPNSQISKMIGIGMPISQSSNPRPMVISIVGCLTTER